MTTQMSGDTPLRGNSYGSIAHRARIHGFEAEGSFEHGTVGLARGGQHWQFTSVMEARRFLDGYELALSTVQAPA